MWFLDTEVYPNYNLICFENERGDRLIYDSESGGDLSEMLGILRTEVNVGFNSLNYDLPIITAISKRSSPKIVYDLSQTIINTDLPWWKSHKMLGVDQYTAHHIDLLPVAPSIHVSLKLYGGRMHTKALQGLPYDPSLELDDSQIQLLKKYCWDDVTVTRELCHHVKDLIDLRKGFSKTYNRDLRSKSDPQIAEILARDITGITAPCEIKYDSCTYTPPSYLNFQTESLNDLLKLMTDTVYPIGSKGNCVLPATFKSLRLNVYGEPYGVGIGGVHSKVKEIVMPEGHYDHLIDCDVTGYYPSIIINNNLTPRHFSNEEKIKFIKGYSKIVSDRVKAKISGDAVTSQTLKIVTNGLFGKMGNPYSAFYAPDMFLFITLTGQLSVLMLVEMLGRRGIRVVGANTDGILSAFDKDQYDDYVETCLEWECITNLNLDFTRYKSFYARSVNDYFAPKVGGGIKEIGSFKRSGLTKSPNAYICVMAVKAYFLDGTSLRDTILKHINEYELFIIVKQVRGGGQWRGEHLGKVVRWFWGIGGSELTYKSTGHKIPSSDGAIPCMELPFDVSLINIDRYVHEAEIIIVKMEGCLQLQGL